MRSNIPESESESSTKAKGNAEDLFYTPTVTESQKNPEYWQLVRNMHEEQAARVFQKRVRKKLNDKDWYKSHKPSLFKYAETLSGPFAMGFITELKDDKSCYDHAAKINAGDWLNIKWDDPYFDLNVFKALRLGLIRINGLANAILLYHALIEFDAKNSGLTPLRIYSFESSYGPYNPDKIKYATLSNIEKFVDSLEEIPPHERVYFTVNFSRLRDAIFLIDGLENNRYEKNTDLRDKFYFILKKYILKSPIEDANKINLLQLIEFITAKQPEIQVNRDYYEAVEAARTELLNTIFELEPSYEAAYTKSKANVEDKNPSEETVRFRKDLSSGEFLGDLIATGEQIPNVEISPDYDENDPNSPLLCMVLLHPTAFTLLSKALHGKDSTEIYFTAGKISTRMIRFLDENPDIFAKSTPQRPVELAHSAFYSNEHPHGADAHKFILAWHDIYHAWRNAAQIYANMDRYLRQLLEKNTGFDMSKVIWSLSDFDFSVHALREALAINKSKLDVQQVVAKHLYTLFKRLNIDFFTNAFKNDNSLLITLDMILNKDKWTELLGCEPLAIFILLNNSNFNHRYDRLRELVDNIKDQPPLFYIIAAKLKDKDTLLIQALQKMDLEKIFNWDRNEGLYVKDSLGKKILLGKLSYQNL